jgi:rhodanese-related sulfurtransferase
MRRLIVLVGVVAAIAVAGYLVFGRGRELPGTEARQLVAAGALLLDVRSADEFSRGHLPRAVNIPVQELDRRLAEVGPAKRDVVVYCRSGHRSARAAQLLREHGYIKVHDLGPMTAW